MANLDINTNTKRHGKAAAIALLARLEGINTGAYGEPQAVKATTDALEGYLGGYARATPKAQAGFRGMVGEIFACMIDCGSLASDALSEPTEMSGPLLTVRERSAHERVWLKGQLAAQKLKKLWDGPAPTTKRAAQAMIRKMRDLEAARGAT